MQIEEAIAGVDRRQFLPSLFVDAPQIEDIAVPVSEGITVPTARITEFLVRLADINPGSIVLEIGTGSGYQSAILARLVAEVHTVEVREIPENLREILPTNVFMYKADGSYQVPPIPFDAIICTCAVPRPYEAWRVALKEGGVLVAPLLNGEVCKYVKTNGELDDRGVFAWADFVPIKSAVIVADAPGI